MGTLITQRLLTNRAMAILLGFTIALLGVTTASGMSEPGRADFAQGNRAWIDLTVDEVRAFHDRMFQHSRGIDDAVTYYFTSDEIYYLEPNLYLPGDTAGTSRANVWTGQLANH
jgi:hypothetical protein